MAGRADPWADVDFEEIQDATCLAVDDIKVLFNCFQLFDVKKQDYLLADDIDEVMRLVHIAVVLLSCHGGGFIMYVKGFEC